MTIQWERLAVAVVVTLALIWVVGMLGLTVVALLTGGWYVAAAIVGFFVTVALVYRITEVHR